jgi:hypothetical protein
MVNQDWRDTIPPGLADTATTQRIDDLLALRGLIEELDAAELLTSSLVANERLACLRVLPGRQRTDAIRRIRRHCVAMVWQLGHTDRPLSSPFRREAHFDLLLPGC